MSPEFEDKPYSDSHLDSPEYRQRLLKKLNTLIAVLEVACAKVRRSLAGPDADVERLNRIQKNLGDTLKVCLRARRALQRSEALPKDLPTSLKDAISPSALGLPAGREPAHANVEMTSAREIEKFQKLGPIDLKEVRTVDLDELCRRLLG